MIRKSDFYFHILKKAYLNCEAGRLSLARLTPGADCPCDFQASNDSCNSIGFDVASIYTVYMPFFKRAESKIQWDPKMYPMPVSLNEC